MVVIQPCQDTSDVLKFYQEYGLFLKPVAKLHISVQLPPLKSAGQTISNWEVMEKLRSIVSPEDFTVIKVAQSTMNFIRFEAELKNRSLLSFVAKRLDQTSMKLSGFPEMLKIRACEARVSGPSRQDWDSFFRDAKNMNEMKPGERPDTIHLANLPCRWFRDRDGGGSPDKPSESMVRNVFCQFGQIRQIDIPLLDPYRMRMDSSLSGIRNVNFGQDSLFEVYIQYQEYIGFVKAMTALRAVKLVKISGDKSWISYIKVDFDKQKHLAESTIKKRKQEREKLQEEDNARELESKRRKDLEMLKEREERRLQELKENEEKEKKMADLERKKKLEKQFEKEEYDAEIKIAVEERKLLLAQRKLESLRLMDVLLNRVKEKMEREEAKKKEDELLKALENLEKKKADKAKMKAEKAAKKQLKLQKLEQEMRAKLMKKYKSLEEQRFEQQKDRLRRAVEGSASKLKSVRVKSEEETPTDEGKTRKKKKKKRRVSRTPSSSSERKQRNSAGSDFENHAKMSLQQYLKEVESGRPVPSSFKDDNRKGWLKSLESRPYRGGPFPPWKRGQRDWPGKHPYGFHHRYIPPKGHRNHSKSRSCERSRTHRKSRSPMRRRSRSYSRQRSRSHSRHRSYSRSRSSQKHSSRNESRPRNRRTRFASRSRSKSEDKNALNCQDESEVKPVMENIVQRQLQRAREVQNSLAGTSEPVKCTEHVEKVDFAENGFVEPSDICTSKAGRKELSEKDHEEIDSVESKKMHSSESFQQLSTLSVIKQDNTVLDNSPVSSEEGAMEAETTKAKYDQNTGMFQERDDRLIQDDMSSKKQHKTMDSKKERTPSLSPDESADDEKHSYSDQRRHHYHEAFRHRGTYSRTMRPFHRHSRGRGRGRGYVKGNHGSSLRPKSYYDLDKDSYEKYFQKSKSPNEQR
ncbi:A-kinase anchor protein 17A-like [Artemia franciscana]|uniref:A-kinase anchor protein 17A n=1 Tax=Artemia franciscana TaxID=6661 RepID=A0AA88HXI9_ARTSF|nr:hypothetical protein QYM36_010550 [Artemia franciscana]